MNDFLIQIYIDRLSKDDITSFAKNKGVTLNNDEIDIIYDYLKHHWRTFYYGNPKELLEELKSKLSEDAYNKIETLYIQAKEELN